MCLIAGGKDKQGDLSALVEPVRAKVTHLVLIGAAAERMAEAFAGLTEIHRAGNMHEAVELCRPVKQRRDDGDVVTRVLQFRYVQRNFEERGQVTRVSPLTREFRALTRHGECSHGN